MKIVNSDDQNGILLGFERLEKQGKAVDIFGWIRARAFMGETREGFGYLPCLI